MFLLAIEVIQDLVPKSKYGIKSPYTMEAEFITYHNTANDADADNEISYMKNNDNEVSYHFAVDSEKVVQGIPVNRNAWHCGDGGNGTGNRKSIGVEVCHSLSGGEKYDMAEELASKFIAQLLHERGWGVNRVKEHNHWSGKNCPHRIRDEGRWNEIIDEIQNELDKLNGKEPSKKVVKTKSTSKPSNMSVVDYLESKGIDSSFANRKKLASKHGIKGYKGTASQNLDLLEALRKEVTISKKSSSKGDMETDSIVAYLKSINVDSSFSNREKLAKEHGIKGYEGTASQNTKLLAKVRKDGVAPKKSKPKGDMNTNSIVEYLQSISEDHSFSNRKKLASKYGIKNYKGTESQNTSLLKKLRGGSTTVKKTATKSSNGIKSIGKIEIVRVKNSAIIMNSPDRKNTTNIGTIAKGKTIAIAGSVRGKNNPDGYWEVIYSGKRAYISAQYGELI